MENQSIDENNNSSWHQRFVNHKHSTFFIAILVLVVATAIAFWMTAPVQKNPKQSLNQQNLATQESTESGGWRTFRSPSSQYGFEIQYPSNWSVKHYAYPTILIIHENQKDFIKISPTDVAEEYAFDAKDPICDIETITFAGKKALDCKTGAQTGDFRYVRVIDPTQPKWGDKNELSYTVYESDREDADDILATFKFIDPKNDPTASWTTYLVNEYGFEFRYPAEVFEDGSSDSDGSWLEMNFHDKVDRQRLGFSVYVNHPGLDFGDKKDIFRGTANVDGIKADKIVLEEIGGHEQGTKTVVYTFSYGEDKYTVVGRGISSNDDLEEILSTFQIWR